VQLPAWIDEPVPAVELDELRAILRRTSAILDFRNAVVHAMYRPFEDGGRHQKHLLQPPPREHFTVEMLVGAAFAAQSVVEYFHSRVGLWPQLPAS
jgi:hypothetical protein